MKARPCNVSARRLAMNVIGALACAAVAASPAAHGATTAEIEARLNALTSQVGELKAELAQIKAQEAAAGKVAPVAVMPAASTMVIAESHPALQWSGYGELNYSRPVDDGSATTADL